MLCSRQRGLEKVAKVGIGGRKRVTKDADVIRVGQRVVRMLPILLDFGTDGLVPSRGHDCAPLCIPVKLEYPEARMRRSYRLDARVIVHSLTAGGESDALQRNL